MRHFTHLFLIGACVALGATACPLPSAHALQQNPYGTNRLSDADLEGKLMELATPVIGDADARALLARIWQLHQSAQLP